MILLADQSGSCDAIVAMDYDERIKSISLSTCAWIYQYDDSKRTAPGVRYYGYRYYNPELGRWLSRDPVTQVDFIKLPLSVRILRTIDWRDVAVGMREVSLYKFCGNQPISRIDYLGLTDDCGCGDQFKACVIAAHDDWKNQDPDPPGASSGEWSAALFYLRLAGCSRSYVECINKCYNPPLPQCPLPSGWERQNPFPI